jgi:glutamine amidotransferase
MSGTPASQPVSIAVVDYGMGNRRSVEKAIEHVGAQATITRDHATLRAADGLVLPGVGSFPLAMQNLRELGLDELLRERVAAGVPLLGVCLGMQLAFERSSEHGGAEGLALIEGDVHELDAHGRKLPHIGWNEVTFARSSPLLDGLPQRCAFYHVHSYAAAPARAHDVLGTAEYGQRFTSAIERPPLYGVQFHPEKSSAPGLRLLANFTRICSAAPALAGAGARAAR